jgi:hypothetical protein
MQKGLVSSHFIRLTLYYMVSTFRLGAWQRISTYLHVIHPALDFGALFLGMNERVIVLIEAFPTSAAFTAFCSQWWGLLQKKLIRVQYRGSQWSDLMMFV